MYESELTHFLKTLHKNNPEINKKQKESQALWSNQLQNETTRKIKKESTIKQNAYSYYPK